MISHSKTVLAAVCVPVCSAEAGTGNGKMRKHFLLFPSQAQDLSAIKREFTEYEGISI